MALTKDDIASMSEAELRQRVLMPLFEAMGYNDVFEYHFGPQEQGKDIVMWKAETIRERVNYSVVAKAERISGQAVGRGSAGEVTMQILETFGAPYQDPRASEHQHVDWCIVVSSQEIKKEATIAISNALASTQAARRVIFFMATSFGSWSRGTSWRAMF